MLLAGCGALGQNAPVDPTTRRLDMVERQIRRRGIADPRVLEAMRAVPRERFVPYVSLRAPTRTIRSRLATARRSPSPYVVAYMTEALAVEPQHKVLEVGIGSGYQPAVLAQLARDVFTIEIVPELARLASDALRDAGYANVHVREGDGYNGWPEHVPFDRIMVTAAPEHIPRPLPDQLAVGGASRDPGRPFGGRAVGDDCREDHRRDDRTPNAGPESAFVRASAPAHKEPDRDGESNERGKDWNEECEGKGTFTQSGAGGLKRESERNVEHHSAKQAGSDPGDHALADEEPRGSSQRKRRQHRETNHDPPFRQHLASGICCGQIAERLCGPGRDA